MIRAGTTLFIFDKIQLEGLLISEKEFFFFQEIKCDGMTSLTDFMRSISFFLYQFFSVRTSSHVFQMCNSKFNLILQIWIGEQQPTKMLIMYVKARSSLQLPMLGLMSSSKQALMRWQWVKAQNTTLHSEYWIAFFEFSIHMTQFFLKNKWSSNNFSLIT